MADLKLYYYTLMETEDFSFTLFQLCSVCSGRWARSPQEIPNVLLWQQLAWLSGWQEWCLGVSLL